MTRLKAQELLEDPDYVQRLTMESFYDLLIRAGYSEEVARRETSELGWARISAGETM